MPELVFGCAMGFGDIITHCWIAEGYKAMGVRCSFNCTERNEETQTGDGQGKEKLELLKVLNQEIRLDYPPTPVGNQNLPYHLEIAAKQNLPIGNFGNPRVLYWAGQMPGSPYPRRPTLCISDETRAKARHTAADCRFEINKRRIEKKMRPLDKPKLAAVFPKASFNIRHYPTSNWLRVILDLWDLGVGAAAMMQDDKENFGDKVPFCIKGMPMDFVIAFLCECDLVIGADSFGVHAGSGAAGVPTLMVGGPTGGSSNVISYGIMDAKKKHIDHHISESPPDYNCIGCWWGKERGYRPECEYGCSALTMLPPKKVVEKACQIMKIRIPASYRSTGTQCLSTGNVPQKSLSDARLPVIEL